MESTIPTRNRQIQLQPILGDIERHPISLGYRLGLFGITIGLFALPVVYLVIVIGVGVGTYLHFRYDYSILQPAGLLGLIIYATPAVIAPSLVWFMLRPFFLKRVRPAPLCEVDAASEPCLFELIEQICDLLRAPRPKQVTLNVEANASAGVNGLRGLIRRELNITLGLPLAAELSISEFAGVLAHELGHFAQGAGMRLSFVIRKFNDWIAQIAFQPNVIEQQIASRIRRGGAYGFIVVLGLRTSLFVTRYLLRGLFLLTHAISCYALRQMEYDADLYEVKVVGTDVVDHLTDKFRWLNAGFAHALLLLERNAGRRRAAADFVELVAARGAAARGHEVWTRPETLPEQSGWFNTHPAAAQRQANTAKFQGSPALTDTRPARLLFSNFSDLSRETTLKFYQQIGLNIEKISLQSLDDVSKGEVLNPRQLQQVSLFFADRASFDRPLNLTLAEVESTDLTKSSSLVSDWDRLREQTEPAFQQYVSARGRAIQLMRARNFVKAHIRFRPEIFRLRRRSIKEIDTELESCSAALLDADQKLQRFDVLAEQRLACAVRAKANGNVPSDIKEALGALADLFPLQKPYSEIYRKLICVSDLLAQRRTRQTRSTAYKQMLDMAAELRSAIQELAPLLADVSDSTGGTVLARVSRRLPGDNLPYEQQALLESREYLTALGSVYFQHLGRLCEFATSPE